MSAMKLQNKAAEAALAELKPLLEGSRRVNGKLTATTIRKAKRGLGLS